MLKSKSFLGFFFLSTLLQAQTIPGGMLLSAVGFQPVLRSQLSLTPSYLPRSGAYLTSRLSFERSESALGMVFGYGREGWHAGAESHVTIWNLSRQTRLAGNAALVYLRDRGFAYFAPNGGITLSHAFSGIGHSVTPYIQSGFSHAVPLGQGVASASFRVSPGLDFEWAEGSHLWAQWTENLSGDSSEVLVGVSIPFKLASDQTKF